MIQEKAQAVSLRKLGQVNLRVVLQNKHPSKAQAILEEQTVKDP